MKRVVLIAAAVCLAVVLAMPGCGADHPDDALSSGTYYAVGDYEETATPYLYLNADDQSFVMGLGIAVSYAEAGSFTVGAGKMTAVSQSTTYVFKIKDPKTLILIDIGDNGYFHFMENTKFVMGDDAR